MDDEELRWRAEALQNVMAALKRSEVGDAPEIEAKAAEEEEEVIEIAEVPQAKRIAKNISEFDSEEVIVVESYVDDIEDLVAEDIEAIEDMRPAWQRWFERRGRSLAVTTICSQMWCELQIALEKDLGRRRVKTQAMQLGNAVHEKLEEDVHGPPIEIVTETFADHQAVRFVDTIYRLRQLMRQGKAREISVVGALDAFLPEDSPSAWCNGIIDEIVIRPWPRVPHSQCFIVDTKTRQQPFLPGIAQKRTTRIQLLLYRYCLDRMMTGKRPETCTICNGSVS